MDAVTSMASKFHQNAILTGCVDSFCLVCESHLRSEQDIASHIETPVHVKNLSSVRYLEKHADDHVRKVKNGYYCEFCNILLPTAAKVGLHVKEQTHDGNKGLQLIKRSGDNVIVFDNILITEQAWNGVVMDTCAVCNMELSNMKLHMAEQKHVLNLILKKVEFAGDTVYRKIDGTSFHCLICNTIFALNSVTTHSREEVHESHVKKGRNFYQTNFENNKKSQYANGIENDKELPQIQSKNNSSINVQANESIHVNNTNEAKTKKSKHNPNVNNTTNTDLGSNCNNTKTECLNDNKIDTSTKDKTKSTQKEKKPTSTPNEMTNDNKIDTSTKDKTKSTQKEKKPTSTPNEMTNDNKIDTSNKDKTKSSEKEKKPTRTSNQMINANKIDISTEDKTKSTQNEKKPTSTPNEMTNAKLFAKEVHQTTNKVNNIKNGTVKIDKDELFEHVTEFQKNGVNINFENETAFCKKCFESVHLDIEVIKKHINEHKSNPKKEVTANTVHTMNQNHSKTVLHSKTKDEQISSKPTMNFDQNHNVTKCNTPKKSAKEHEEEIIKIDLRKKPTEDIDENTTNNAITRYVPGATTAELPKSKETAEKQKKYNAIDMNDLEVFAKHNDMTYNKGNSNAFCRICSTRVPAAMQNMKEHIKGMPHKTNMARIAQKNVIPKKPMGKFILYYSTVNSVFGDDDVVVNDKFCLTRMSYYMITSQQRLRCQACEVNLNENEVSRHVDGVFHERAMERTPVVTSLGSDFIREVRSGLFHCGYCNLMVGAWAVVAAHVQSAEHAAQAHSARRRLGQHLPNILAHRHSRAFLQHFWPFF